MKSVVTLALLLTGALLCAGCFSLTNFQSPEVLLPRRTSVGMGLTYSYPLPEANLMVRYGLSDNVDVGGKLSLPFDALTADAKWQLSRGPRPVALDFGGSFGLFAGEIDAPEDLGFITAFPELLLGFGRMSGAARVMMVYQVDLRYHRNNSVSWVAQLFFGGPLGSDSRVRWEASLRSMSGAWFPMPGIGVSYQFRP